MSLRDDMARDIRVMQWECALELSDEVCELCDPILQNHLRDLDAKRAWLRGLEGCSMCHGTGVCLEPVHHPVQVLREDNGKLYARGSVVVAGCVYPGWVEVPMSDLLTLRTREVVCYHGAKRPAEGGV